MKRTIPRLMLVFVMIALVLFGSSQRSTAQAGDPYSMIDAVNNLRVANGLTPYETNGILMSIAQGHSDYQAAIGQVTHIGPGGTHPKDRAAAAGYGGGGTFFISENIAGGTDFSVDYVVSMWLGDAPHTQTMLGTNYQNIGAGVAVSNGFVYYTIDVASGSGGGNYKPAATSTPGGPTPIPIYLVQTSTPNPDGSIIHTVRSGQTLIGIAKAYGIVLGEIMDLNYLTSDVIYEGDQLIIRKASTPGPTETSTTAKTPTRAATATRYPTRTPTQTPSPIPPSVVTPAAPAAQAQKQASAFSFDQVGDILVIAIVVLAAGGIILMLVGSFMKRRTSQ